MGVKMHYSLRYIPWLSDGLCRMSSPSAIMGCCTSGQLRTAETQVIPLCSITLPGNGQNRRSLIKSLECRIKVNKKHMAAHYHVTSFIFFSSLPDLKTSDRSDSSVAKTKKPH